MADVRLTVHRLISLAVNAGANEHEARNAALQACRLIHQHGLLPQSAPPPVPAPAAEARYPPRPPAKTWKAPATQGFDDFINEFVRATHAAKVAYATQTRVDVNDFATNSDDFVPPPPQPTIPGSDGHDTDVRVAKVLEAAWCADCGGKIRRGVHAAFRRGVVFHLACYYKAAVGDGGP